MPGTPSSAPAGTGAAGSAAAGSRSLARASVTAVAALDNTEPATAATPAAAPIKIVQARKSRLAAERGASGSTAARRGSQRQSLAISVPKIM